MKKSDDTALNFSESPELSSDERAFFEKIPTNGSPETHHAVYRALGWDDLRFWKARDSLVQRGFIKTAPGKTGVAYQRIQVPLMEDFVEVEEEDEPRVVEEIPTSVPQKSGESQLHDYFTTALEKWALENHFANYFIEVTSGAPIKPGHRLGRTPDMILVSVETFQYLPNKYLELLSYTVRGVRDWSVEAVFETASYSRFSNRAYLALQKDVRTGPPAGLEVRIEEECRKFGVGLIIFEDPGDYATFQFKIAPQKTFFDPREVDKMLENLSPENRESSSVGYVKPLHL